ncbi:MAG: hypothetical protein J7K61_04080, partial [Thermoplasmata archaeon]|nr:hypothetical protein [Thermoplasmata archaeon]
LLFTRYRKKSMRMKHIIAMAIVHNINTYMAISLFILIYSTNPGRFYLQSSYKVFYIIAIFLSWIIRLRT